MISDLFDQSIWNVKDHCTRPSRIFLLGTLLNMLMIFQWIITKLAFHGFSASFVGRVANDPSMQILFLRRLRTTFDRNPIGIGASFTLSLFWSCHDTSTGTSLTDWVRCHSHCNYNLSADNKNFFSRFRTEIFFQRLQWSTAEHRIKVPTEPRRTGWHTQFFLGKHFFCKSVFFPLFATRLCLGLMSWATFHKYESKIVRVKRNNSRRSTKKSPEKAKT